MTGGGGLTLGCGVGVDSVKSLHYKKYLKPDFSKNTVTAHSTRDKFEVQDKKKPSFDKAGLGTAVSTS